MVQPARFQPSAPKYALPASGPCKPIGGCVPTTALKLDRSIGKRHKNRWANGPTNKYNP